MSIKQLQVNTSHLALGMYVSKLDRPWSQTPFPLQGFLIRTPKDVNMLKAYCEYVYIDVSKGRAPLEAGLRSNVNNNMSLSDKAVSNTVATPSNVTENRSSAIVVRRNVYQKAIPLSIEVKQAEVALNALGSQLAEANRLIAKDKPIDYPELRGSVNKMVDSVIRCPDAFTWLMRLRMKDQYTHDHSLRSALWATQFGRFIGLPKEEMSMLCMGVLMKDIGKLKVPSAILRKHSRTPEEEQVYRSFVDKGVEMLRKTANVEPRVIAVVKNHCERFNGSGFPQGIANNKIPLLAQIAGIATTYDAISNPRESSDPMAPSKAVSALYNVRDKLFQEDLVVQFIKSIGLYPTGTVIELTTGDIGVVIEQHEDSRLTPKVAVMGEGLSSDGYVLVDLLDEQVSRKVLVKRGFKQAGVVAKLAIARDLEPSGYGIDMDAVSNLFMDSAANQLSKVAGGKASGFFAQLRSRLG